MFDTNYSKLEENYRCDDDCVQSGCPGHNMQLIINNTAGVGTLIIDGKQIHIFDRSSAASLHKIFNKIESE